MESEGAATQLKERIVELEQKLAQALAQLETANKRIAKLEKLKTQLRPGLNLTNLKLKLTKKSGFKNEH